MAEADLSQTTFTSRSASDPDHDISTEDSSENENENTYTEASSDNSSSDPETESIAKSEVRKAKADLNWIKFSKPLWKLCYALRKRIETKRTKKRLSLWHG